MRARLRSRGATATRGRVESTWAISPGDRVRTDAGSVAPPPQPYPERPSNMQAARLFAGRLVLAVRGKITDDHKNPGLPVVPPVLPGSRRISRAPSTDPATRGR